MSRSIQNTIANFGGLISTVAFAFLFAVAYFHILGSESYGLISFCTTVLFVGSSFADMGVGRAITRELSRREHLAELAQEMHDALFTLQAINFGFAIICGAAILASAHWLAANWLQLGSIDIGDASGVISLLGIVAILQFPREVCRAALAGLQRQVFVNAYLASFSLLRGIATVAALYAIAPTPSVFLVTQVVVSGLETTMLTIAVWHRMPVAVRWPRFEVRIIKETWAFAVADGLGILVFAGIMMGDRILLSRLLPLDVFGSYSFTVLVADTILRVPLPFTSAFFPHLTNLIARDDRRELSREYYRATVVLAAILVPAAFIMTFFSADVLQLASHGKIKPGLFAPVLAIRALANGMTGLLQFPHTLQLATGLSTVAPVLNFVALIIYLPGIVFLTPVYGIVAPAVLWLCISIASVIPMVMITHRRALQGEAWIWFKESVMRPVLISAVIIFASSWLAPRTVSWLITVPWIAVTYLFAITAILLSSERTRSFVQRIWNW